MKIDDKLIYRLHKIICMVKFTYNLELYNYIKIAVTVLKINQRDKGIMTYIFFFTVYSVKINMDFNLKKESPRYSKF